MLRTRTQVAGWNAQTNPLSYVSTPLTSFCFREDIYVSDCGRLNGSAGEFFPSYREKTHVDFFTPDLCRFYIIIFCLPKKAKASRNYLSCLSCALHLDIFSV